jgi:predicted Zn-dependent peptidase
LSVQSTVLDNGMTVLTHAMPHLESASVGVWVKSGSRSERASEHGISHLLEHMAFKGTKTRSAREIVEAVETVGGSMNAATSVENTGYFVRVLKEDVGLGADILADILQNSVFDRADLTREQNVIVQEIGASHDDPDHHVFDLFQNAVFPDQPIGRNILGTEETVRGFSPDDLRTYMDRNYVGDRMVLAAAGNVDHAALVDQMNDKFANLKADGAPAPVPATYVGGDERLERDHEQAQVIIGLEGRAYNGDGYYAAQILGSILGGGMSSRLFQEVREKRGLCYSVYAFHWAFEDSGVFAVSASTGEDQVADLVPVIIDELARATRDITEQEVVRVRNQIRARLLMALESPSSRAGQLASQFILWGRAIPLEETIARIDRITADRVKQVATELFGAAKPTVAGLGPIAGLPSVSAVSAALKG